MAPQDTRTLTRGNILKKLLRLALPIMGTQFMVMAYNLTDMFWLGRIGSGAVAASGTVGIYMWLSMALMNLGGKGAEIGVSQNLGRGDAAAARGYGQSALSLAFFLGIFYGAVLIIFRTPLIGFFNIKEADVVADAVQYLSLVALGIPFNYIMAAAVGTFNGSGNSAIPFFSNGLGLVLNIILDPLLIFGAGMGIAGAAVATVLAQGFSCVILLAALKHYRHHSFDSTFRLLTLPKAAHLRQILRWAGPIAIESFFFSFLIMFISRFVAAFGAGAIATQRIGSQVESFSYLIAGGFASAFTAFVGQNYGAGRFDRIRRGFFVSIAVMGVWGVATTLLLFFGGGFIFSLFLPGEPEVVAMGDYYLKVLAGVQVLGCLEPIASGAFRGQGITAPPAAISVSCNVIRVLLAWVLSNAFGINGIWWALTIGAGLRGAAQFVAFLIYYRKMPKKWVRPAKGAAAGGPTAGPA